MANETLYSSDKERLLRELKTASSSSARLPAQDAEALRELCGQAAGLPKPVDPQAKQKSPGMTNNELKAMKSVTIKVQEDPKAATQVQFFQAVIRCWDGMQGMFRLMPRKTNAVTCKESGHICTHCGTRIAYEYQHK